MSVLFEMSENGVVAPQVQPVEAGSPMHNPNLFTRVKQTIGRGALALSLVAGATTGIGEAVVENPSPAFAATTFNNDYPDQDAMDHRPSVYEWWKDENGDGRKQITDDNYTDNDETMSSRGYGYRNCTDGVAYWVGKYTGVGVSGWGNAEHWDAAASGVHAVYDGTTNNIEPGDIAQSDDGSVGHVGFVTKVTKNQDGSIASFETAELNRSATGEYSANTYSTRNPAGKFSRPGGGNDWDHFIDVNGPGKGLGNENWPGGSPDTIDELGFLRLNHYSGNAGLVTYEGAPSYYAMYSNALTAYPAVSDTQNVKALAIDVNGDGIDELGFVRLNHYSGNTGIVTYSGVPGYQTLYANALTGYPAISDPENVTPLAIDVNGDGVDELAFVRMNHYLGRTGIDVYTNAPYYNTLLASGLTGYPAISDPWNVRPIAIDVNGDKTDELGFVRLNNNGSGRAAIDVYYGTPTYYALYSSGLTGYPSVSDPENVRPLAIDLNQDKTDELAFVRLNHYSGQAGIVAYNGTPTYYNLYANYLLPYPSVSDPQNVTPLALSLNGS